MTNEINATNINDVLAKAAEVYIKTAYKEQYEVECLDLVMSQDKWNGYDLLDAFKEGAKWQRNGVWHSADEEPDPSRLLCICCANFRDKIIVIDEYKPKEQRFYYEDGEHYDYISLNYKGLRWAYIEDLLPEYLTDL